MLLVFLTLGASTAVVARSQPAATRLAWPVAGEVAGTLDLSAHAPDLKVDWSLRSTSEGITLVVRSPGVAIDLDLAPPSDGSLAWSWQVARGEIDLAEVWPVVRPVLGNAAASWSASGTIALTGQGRLDPSLGEAPEGLLRLALREGWARSDALDVELRGIEADLFTEGLTRSELPAGQQLRVSSILAQGVELRALFVHFGLQEGLRLAVSRTGAEFLGGRLTLRPFVIALENPRFEGAAEMDGVRLGELATLLPWAVQSAEGTLRGRIEVSYDAQRGLRVRDGGLDIVRLDGATLRLAPSPGLFTGGQSSRLALLPSTWGPLSRLLSLNNPAYEPLRRLELGEDGLVIEEMSIAIRPDGPEGQRTAVIRLAGRPASGRLVERVSMEVNFFGPWTEFLAFGLSRASGMSYQAGTR